MAKHLQISVGAILNNIGACIFARFTQKCNISGPQLRAEWDIAHDEDISHSDINVHETFHTRYRGSQCVIFTCFSIACHDILAVPRGSILYRTERRLTNSVQSRTIPVRAEDGAAL